MKALFALLPMTIFALASCGKDQVAEVGSSLQSSGPAKTCQATCSTPADCATPGQPLQDASHFACTNGRCVWQGCKSTGDCTSAFPDAPLTCAVAPGTNVPSCMRTCRSAKDCAVRGNPLGDAGHFACNEGKCEWRGCTSHSDCTTALRSSKFACEKEPDAPVPTCTPICSKAADCAIPGNTLQDARHFACNAGRCVWLGCQSHGECTTALRRDKLVCE